MRHPLLLVLLSLPGLAGSPANWTGDLSPIPDSEWNYDRAAHLLERAGFGGTPEEIQALAAMSARDAVKKLVYFQQVREAALPAFRETGIYSSPRWNRTLNAAAFRHILFGTLDKLPADQRRMLMDDAMTGVTPEVKRIAKTDKQAVVDQFYFFRNADQLESQRAQTWLVDRALKSNRPLREKLVIFWHGHFATSDEKIRDYRKMLRQFEIFREHGNGSFRDMLIAVSKDPAMLIYLDNRDNLKGHPNENYAREIMELFSLGVGNYTEKDIKEAARALTGWTLDRTWTDFQNRPELHDDGEKTLLGKTGRFRGEDIVDIILEQPAAGRFLSRKLYRFFVKEEINAAFEEKLAAKLRGHKYQIGPFLEELFLSRDFHGNAAVATQIKSPVQLVVSTYRKLGLRDAPTYPKFNYLTAGLGQEIFYPPNVKGWDGGKTWINPSTVFQRQNVARYILFPEELRFPRDAHLEGSRRLSGDNIHNQFLEMAERGNLTDFPNTGMTSGKSAGAETSKLSGEDFNLFRGVFNAGWRAVEAVPPEARKVPEFSLVKLLRNENVKDAAAAVDALMKRFLRAPLSGERRQALISFLEKQQGGSAIDYSRYDAEKNLRELLHLIMSAPEYQLS